MPANNTTLYALRIHNGNAIMSVAIPYEGILDRDHQQLLFREFCLATGVKKSNDLHREFCDWLIANKNAAIIRVRDFELYDPESIYQREKEMMG